jgi:hypothetical protein
MQTNQMYCSSCGAAAVAADPFAASPQAASAARPVVDDERTGKSTAALVLMALLGPVGAIVGRLLTAGSTQLDRAVGRLTLRVSLSYFLYLVIVVMVLAMAGANDDVLELVGRLGGFAQLGLAVAMISKLRKDGELWVPAATIGGDSVVEDYRAGR